MSYKKDTKHHHVKVETSPSVPTGHFSVMDFATHENDAKDAKFADYESSIKNHLQEYVQQDPDKPSVEQSTKQLNQNTQGRAQMNCPEPKSSELNQSTSIQLGQDDSPKQIPKAESVKNVPRDSVKHCNENDHPKNMNVGQDQSSRLDRLLTTCKSIINIYKISFLTMIAYLVIFIPVSSSMKFVSLNENNVNIYLTATTMTGGLSYFASVWTLSAYIFEPKIAIRSMLRQGIFWLLLNQVLVIIRNFLILNPLFGITYYVAVITHHLFFSKSIQKWGQRSVSQKKQLAIEDEASPELTRAEILATDGTPMMLVKSFYLFLFLYYICVQFFVITAIDPETSAFTRVTIRLFIVPFIFAVSEYLQAKMASGFSTELMRYRYLQQRITSFVHIMVLRFLVANSKNNQEVALITIISCIMEIVARTTYLKRLYLASKIERKGRQIMKKLISALLSPRKATYQISVVDQHSIPENSRPENQDCPNHQASPHECWEEKMTNMSFQDWSRSDEAQKMALFVNYQEHQNMQNEFQAIIALAFVSYMFNPIQDYVLFETTSDLSRLGTSVAIQMVLEFTTDVSCNYLTNHHHHARELKTKEILMHSIQNISVLACSVLIPVGSFLKSPEEYLNS